MGYYTIWLALVKSFFVPVLGIEEAKIGAAVPASLREFKPAALKPKAAAPGIVTFL
jgi:hypothetical protein